MCGLVGMMGPGVQSDDLKMMKDLAYICGLRGKDGSGILQGFGSKWRKEYKVSKTWQEISYLLWFNEWSSKGDRKFLSSVQDNYFAVHCRWATVGANSDENSHPFDTKNLVGMHNGTLEDMKYYDHRKTDSEMMFDDMSNRGIIPVLQDLDLKSAYAIVIFDKNSGELVFSRNNDRPLYFAHNLERGVTYWASEPDMLRLAAGRNKIKLSTFVYLKPNAVYRVDPTQCKKAEWPKWTSTDLFPQGEPSKTQSVPPVKENLETRPFKPANTQESVELERAIASGEDLISSAKAARSVALVPRILDGSVESSRLWDDVKSEDLPWDDEDVFDKQNEDSEVLLAKPRNAEDFRFNPVRIPKDKCTFCGDELDLLQRWYASTYDNGNVISCQECTDLSKEVKDIQCH